MKSTTRAQTKNNRMSSMDTTLRVPGQSLNHRRISATILRKKSVYNFLLSRYERVGYEMGAGRVWIKGVAVAVVTDEVPRELSVPTHQLQVRFGVFPQSLSSFEDSVA